MMDLQRAKDMVEFRMAVLKFRGFSASFLFASYLGDVGYWAAGQIPRRTSINESLYVRTARSNQSLFLETELNPHIINPEKGFIVSCSNKISQSGLFLGIGSTVPGNARASEAHEKLYEKVGERKAVSMEDVKQMQRSVHSKYADVLLPLMVRIVRNERERSKEADHLIDILEKWDRNMNADSKGALVYNVWIEMLFELMLKDSFSKDEMRGEMKVIKASASAESFVGTFINNLLNRRENLDERICASGSTKGSCGELLVISLSKTYEFILQNIGKSERNWRWDYLNTQDYYHPVYTNSWLSFLFHKKARSGV
eukprot:TRINITY_DN2060_c0_g1_i19.p1 TRINITY_DN2060_c0_g1~~TRINITY_DN2060_c0_g1_i19.p1  ORF type:complete len:313 (-),score=77.15 TRINITY_DN2060_c0_g1_i19:305-1243(-)